MAIFLWPSLIIPFPAYSAALTDLDTQGEVMGGPSRRSSNLPDANFEALLVDGGMIFFSLSR